MISPDVLVRLVPDRDPKDDSFVDKRPSKASRDGPERRIGLWSAYLRHQLERQMLDEKIDKRLVDSSGFIGTGIFRVPSNERSFDGFPVVDGYQFGAVLFRGAPYRESREDYVEDVELEPTLSSLKAPVIQVVADFNSHVRGRVYPNDGYVAALYHGTNNETFGITAAHVVKGFRKGQRVPVICSECGAPARLVLRAPGFIDAAKISFRCDGPGRRVSSVVRSAVEGEIVEAHLGDTGILRSTVMLSLSSPNQIKCAATPQHFLTEMHGHPGDSGSLVSGVRNMQGNCDLIGIYLGEANCEDRRGNSMTYGYALDLQQAADMLDATNIWGAFNDNS